MVPTRITSPGSRTTADNSADETVLPVDRDASRVVTRTTAPTSAQNLGDAAEKLRSDFDRIVDPKTMVGDPRRDLGLEPGDGAAV
jgi:hypothetical protein